MKRRNFLKILGLAAVPAVANALPNDILEPCTAEELFHAINRLCEFGGWSNIAYEDKEGKRYTHKTYAVISGNGDETKMVKVLWKSAKLLVENNEANRPVIIWRWKPEIRYDDGKSMLWMRFSMGPDGSSNYNSIAEKKAGSPAIYI